ncbi:ABC transporter component [Actinomyces sp. Chiba101]|uniref:Multiple sugar transport system substrate-binding protein n=1 Tax=Actinomyces denticolens TaxID=52767 RepID=A0ABY1HZC9_9ACTO|nr:MULTISPECIES: ABC transporter substrate-binding protein [Actinomyces]BAW93663.1 ABC transporter component [Actinomyces sp. Chiba101]GAV93487.1 ABC transporter, ATP-binding protein [Actinomyces denticolens]SHI31964.1 multiple sugar transport system substrate-binding protein [Actinomyces denticolens]SUU74618.1 Probable ABC transporter-binding protein DR_1438 precursor [Actinomyces denticolens]
MTSSLPRRRFIQGSALAAAGAAVAACSGGAGASTEITGTGPITWVQGKDNSGGMVKKRIDQWNAENPGEEVTLIELSSEADQQRQSMINNAQTKSDAYDVISVDLVWIAEFAAHRWIIELPQEQLSSPDVIESVWDTGIYRDRLFAMPFATDSSMMYYRKDFLAEAGIKEPPKDWEGIKKAIDAVRALPGHSSIGGFGGQYAKYEGLTCCSSEFINTAGGSFYDEQGEVTINSPEAVTGLQNLMDAFTGGYIPKESLEWKEEDGRNAFESGNLLFYRQWAYQYKNDMESLGEDKFAVAPLPMIDGKKFVPTLGGHNCAISAYSKNKATALRFIQWFTSLDSERYALETQTLAPIVGSLYEDPAQLETFPFLPTLRESLDSARSRPKAVYYGDVTAAIQDAFYPAITGATTAQAAISGLEATLKSLS